MPNSLNFLIPIMVIEYEVSRFLCFKTYLSGRLANFLNVFLASPLKWGLKRERTACSGTCACTIPLHASHSATKTAISSFVRGFSLVFFHNLFT